MDETWKPATLAAQALGWVDPATGALAPSLHPSTTFLRDPDNAYSRGFAYGRDQNPTYAQAEALLTRLEGGAATMLFASGMAAATSVFQALRPGDHVVAPVVLYWGLRNWLSRFADDWGVAVDFVDMANLEALRAAVRPGATRLPDGPLPPPARSAADVGPPTPYPRARARATRVVSPERSQLCGCEDPLGPRQVVQLQQPRLPHLLGDCPRRPAAE